MRLNVPFVLLLALMMTMGMVLGSRRHRRQRNKSNQAQPRRNKCKYFRKGIISDCDPATNMRSVTFQLKKGENCPPTQVYHQSCTTDDGVNNGMGSQSADCRYSRSSPWSECGPNILTKTKVMTLKPGQPATCPPTRTKTAPCRSGKRNKPDQSKKKGCKYVRNSQWSECAPGDTVKTKVMNLEPGQPTSCPATRTKTASCKARRRNKAVRPKKTCKYFKGSWSDCDASTNTRTRELTLKKGDASVCLPKKTITKKCKKQCRYKPSDWGECDNRTHTMVRILTLKMGDPDLCQLTKQLVRRCKPCHFTRGEWSPCNASFIKTRTDILVRGNTATCERSRTITKSCGKKDECKYSTGPWSDCDPETKERMRVKTLTSGNATKCEKEIQVRRRCHKPNGEESCFLGPWGDYGPCQQGVMMKHRQVIGGGVECERKAVKFKPCS